MWGVTGCTGYIVEGTLIIILLRVTGCAAIAMIRADPAGRWTMDDATITMPRRGGSVRVPLAVCAVCRARTKSLVSHYCLFGLFIEHCVAPVCACGPTA